jgi:Flp pilus assembly protein TadD
LAYVEGDRSVQVGAATAVVLVLGGEDQAAEGTVRDLAARAEPARVEAEVNALGYAMMRMQRVEQALKLFELNTRVFPEAWNTWDSLGEAHMRLGHDEEAIRAYERSLQLNPNNTNAQTMISRIRKGAGQPN